MSNDSEEFIDELMDCMRCGHSGHTMTYSTKSDRLNLDEDEEVVVCPKCGSEDYYITDSKGGD